MQCYHCKHDFCWMCLGDWKTHGSEYYECSRYKENPNIAHESAHAQAREALKKYLHYFERVRAKTHYDDLKSGFIFVQHLRGFVVSCAIWKIAFYPRLPFFPQILTLLKFWYHLAHSFSRKNVPFDSEREGFLRG